MTVPPAAVGIDLGTSRLAVAALDAAGRSTMLARGDGELLTPSLFYRDGEDAHVGAEARRAAVAAPERLLGWSKACFGAAPLEAAAPTAEPPAGPRADAATTETVLDALLPRLAREITTALDGRPFVCALSTPEGFDAARRQRLAAAGAQAGLDVVALVDEPLAAALAFSEREGWLSPQAEGEAANVLLCDLGGSAAQTAVVRLAPGRLNVRAMTCDLRLGGADWDERLLQHVLDEFRRSHLAELRPIPEAVARLRQEVVEAKHTLSARSRAGVLLDFGGRSLESTVTREQFENLTAELVARLAAQLEHTLAAAGLARGDIDRVVAIGGATRMPMIRRLLNDLSGRPCEPSLHADEAVARGSAIYAGWVLRRRGGAALGDGANDFLLDFGEAAPAAPSCTEAATTGAAENSAEPEADEGDAPPQSRTRHTSDYDERKRARRARAAPPRRGRRPAAGRFHWLFAALWYLSSAVIGLTLGYYLLTRLRPETFPWPFW